MPKPHAPACDRNREPILEVLRRHLPASGQLLEIGSGTGQHAAYFAAAMPGLIWQCSDLEENLPGIRLWIEEARRGNLPEPLLLDVERDWPRARYDALFSANTLHIMRWGLVQAMFEHLPAGARAGQLRRRLRTLQLLRPVYERKQRGLRCVAEATLP